MSLAVVLTALPARLVVVPVAALAPQWPVVINLLAGSRPGPGTARLGRRRCARWPLQSAHRTAGPDGRRAGAEPPRRGATALALPGLVHAAAGLVAGVGIGVVSSIMGAAGGGLLIPAIVLLHAWTPSSPEPVAGGGATHDDRRVRPLQP